MLDKSGRTDGTWSRADFEWDPENNQYICPEGEPLKQFRRNYSDPNRGLDGKDVAKYRELKLTCQACPSKAKCCPNADFRSITCEEHEDARPQRLKLLYDGQDTLAPQVLPKAVAEEKRDVNYSVRPR